VLNFGPDSNNKFVTSYFRHAFNVTNPGAFVIGLLRVRRDDGVILYLNGTEIFRDGFNGDVIFSTYANNAGDDGQILLNGMFVSSLLVPGVNVLAAEVHQNSGSSSDLSFDVELVASAGNPTVSLTSPTEGGIFTTPAVIGLAASASDPDGTVALVEFYQGNTKVGQDTDSPYTFDWAVPSVGNFGLRAIATDNVGLKGTSVVVNVVVGLGSVPSVVARAPVPGAVTTLSTIGVTFSEAVSGVDAGDLLVNGVPATSVTANSPSNYLFTIVRPADGTVYVAWKGGHGIADAENPPKPFDNFGAGATWQYTLTDNAAPLVAVVSPAAGATVNQLDAIEVSFNEPVMGIEPTDLRINGAPAATVSGTGAGPYRFTFVQPANGTVTMSWVAGHGIRDLSAARNAFAGGNWTYSLNSAAVWEGQVVISEIMFHPSSELVAEEFIELRNRGATAVNLNGWRLNRAVDFSFPNINLPAGGNLVVAANLAAFNAKYPGVTAVVGNWSGRLSNVRDEIELEDASGEQVDLVEYADQGEWAVRQMTGLGWDWSNPADGFGSSLELRQVSLPNDSGQNWLPSTVPHGTPGQANSVATGNLAPLILEPGHLPIVPRSTNAITFLARIVDEATSGLTVRLWRRDITTSLDVFVSTPMLDNGLSNDGAAGDGLYAVVVPAQGAGTIGEYYIEAVDAAGNSRTWPPAADPGDGSRIQEANALYQVDDEVYAGRQPFYRIIMRPGDRADFFGNFDRIQRNATFVTVEGSDVEIRHNCGARRRGASSFGAMPPTMKFDIPRDRLWNGKSSINLNSVNVHAQVLGSAVARRAGLAAPNSVAVQLRFNGVNESSTGGGMFGSYAAVEVVNDEWARDHFPEDSNGNVYSKRRPECGLEYQGATPEGYIGCGYDKESNASDNDWTDLMNLTFALDADTTPSHTYVAAVRQNLQVEQWMRHFAVLTLMNYNETALVTGADDDYNMYRGIIDPRFLLLPHDLDTIFGVGGNAPNNLFEAARIPTLARFLRHPTFEPLYYAEYRHQLANAFATNTLFAIMDQVLGEWVPGPTIQSMKNNAAARISFVAGALPAAPAAPLATVTGEPDSPTFLTTASLTVGGTGVTHYRYRLNGGAWSAERLVSQSIDLTGLTNGHYTVFVIGRNSGGTWQAEADATASVTWAVLTGLRGVVINEVLARNDGVVNHEGTFPDIIELYNPPGGASVDLSGYRLTDDLAEPNKFTFPAGTTLAAGAYRVLYANNPDGTSGLHVGFGLSQEGDSLYLLDRSTNGIRIIDAISFGWQLSNRSIGRLANGQWGLANPTAGAVNTAVPLGPTGTLKINEWLASPVSPLVNDFVELFNPDPLPVNLGGLYLTDQPIGSPTRHRIRPLSFIDAFGYRAFIADGDVEAGAEHLDFSLSAEGGEIGLVARGGSIIDQVVYSTQFAGVSQGRSPNGGTRIVYFSQPTPGAGNPVAPGPVEPTVTNLVPLNDSFLWRYDDTGADLGTSWSARNYDDSAWPSGPGVLAGEANPQFQEPIRTPLAVAGPKITYYFRAHFNLPAGLSISGLRATHLIDDGAVFYVNGIEVGRFQLPPFPTVINNGTLANSHEATGFEESTLNPAPLVVGDNVIAVEVHQSQPTSGDLVFGLRLDVLTVTNNPVTAGLKINEVLANARASTNANGTITDWVELYNPSTASVDLAGMSFTDQLSNPRRWVFPAGVLIGAGAYRVVLFNPEVAASTNVTALLNTGFGLKSGGDSLYLFNRPQSGGELLDAITFGIQAADYSIGRVPNGSTNWVLNVPSQGSVNLAATLGNRASLRVNEWMAAPVSGPDWFELYNPNAQPVELSGLHLTDDLNDRLKFPPLPPRSYIAAGLEGFQMIIADGDVTAGADHAPFALGRTGEDLGISDAYGTLIDSYRFGAQLTGVSQGRLPDGTTNVVSFVESPSPNESNYLPIPNVVINEVLTDSTLPYEDAIELRNLSAAPVNISGWYLSDSRTALRRYRIPNNTIIPANGFKVFYEAQFNSIPNDPGSFSLSSARGDNVYLSVADAQNVLTGYRAQVSFGAAAGGVSFGRYVTSALNGNKADFVAMTQRTFGVDNPGDVNEFRTGTGRTNSGPRIGPVVISEIMYHPIDLVGGFDNHIDEYVELQNITASPVQLYDAANPANRWRLKDAVSFDFPANTVIPANGFIVVVSFNPADTATLNSFKSRFNIQAGAIVLGPFEGRLDNSSESVELARPDVPIVTGPDAGVVPYILVDKVKYFDASPWPTAPDGSGQSLTRVTAANYGNDPINWTAANPTPGPQGVSNDTDGDGMPNTWEAQFGLNQNVNDAALDLDGDGLRNLDEYFAGTAPNDPNSVLRLTITPGAPVTLRFNAAANLGYVIEHKSTLAPGIWTVLQTVPAGTARLVQITDPSPGISRYYRLRTQ
jgi:hypothetical protein